MAFSPPSAIGSIMALAAVGALTLGCSTSSGGATLVDAGGGDGDVVACTTDPRVDVYAANMTKASASGAVKITLVQGDPAPPVRGSNTWTIKVNDSAGAPLQNAAVSVLPFMPDHGHGSSIVATVTAQPDGTYSVTPLYLFMPGVWRVTFSVSAGSGDAGADAAGADAGAVEQVAFFFCIPG